MLIINAHNSIRRTVDLSLVQQIAKEFSNSQFSKRDSVVELSVISADKMRQLNKKHRGIDKPTDVLSFNAAPMPPIKGQPEVLGELFVCYDKVIRQAKEYGHSTDRELSYLIVHGILHLLGHDHQVLAERRKMNAEAERIMAALRLSR